MAQPEHTRRQESSSSAKQLGMQFPIGLPGQLVPPTLPCRHVFAQVLQLNFMQKKALFPLHLVVLSDPSHFFFQNRETISVEGARDPQLVSHTLSKWLW